MIYKVRVYCEEDAQYYYTNQTVLDENWIPHSGHTFRDFTILQTVDSIKNFKINNDTKDPTNLNINLFGLHKKLIFDSYGCLITKEYYKNYDGSIYSDLIVKDEYVYNIDTNDLVKYRDETITWYYTDNTIGQIKTFRKYYSIKQGIKEGIIRRTNLINQAKEYGLINILGIRNVSGESIQPNSHYFFSLLMPNIEKYIKGILKQDLIDQIQTSNEPFLDQTIKDNLEGILKYWT